MAKKTVTLYLDDTSLRVMGTSGKRIKKWADMPLPPGLVKNSVVIKEADVATRIKQIFKALKIKRKKVAIGVSGLHCLSRPITLPQLPREMLDEAVRREAKRLLPVSLEQLYLSWQIIPGSEGKIQVFMVAVPRKAADALFRTLHQAGLKSHLMDLKPILLARVVRETTAIIVDVQPTEFDIVIMADGIPQPIRTVSLPSESLLWQEKLPLIREELDRTIKFFNANNPGNPLLPSVPIFASGALADEPELCQSLSAELGHPVLKVPSPWECPEGLDPNRYIVNIGLALKELTPEKERVPLVPNLNTLPVPYRPQPISLVRVFVPPVTTVAIALIAFMVMLVQDASASGALMHSQLNTTSQLIQQKLLQTQELKNKIAEIEKKIAEAEKSDKSFISAVTSIKKQKEEVNGNLKVAVRSLTETVQLTYLSQSKSVLTIKGKAPSEKEILAYLNRLNDSGRFAEITITRMNRIEGVGMDFALALKTGGQK